MLSAIRLDFPRYLYSVQLHRHPGLVRGCVSMSWQYHSSGTWLAHLRRDHGHSMAGGPANSYCYRIGRVIHLSGLFAASPRLTLTPMPMRMQTPTMWHRIKVSLERIRDSEYFGAWPVSKAPQWLARSMSLRQIFGAPSREPRPDGPDRFLNRCGLARERMGD